MDGLHIERQGAPVVHSTRVAFITVEIREALPDSAWHVYTVSSTDETYIDSAVSLDDAYRLHKQTVDGITRRILSKRKGRPTPAQLATLFSLKIPIPLDLTWGQASDMIDAALTEKQNERRAKLHLVGKGITR